MKRKIFSIALALCMVLTMMPMATGVAWAATVNVTISDAAYYGSGALQKIEGSFSRNTASATSRLVLMSTHLRDDDLTNLGNYGTKFDDFDKVIAYDNDVAGGTAGNFGIKKCTDDMAEKSGENDFIFNFSESDIPLSANATYYVYLWTYWSQFGPKYYYPDHLICAIQVKDCAVKYAVATGGNTYNESGFSDIESSAKYTVTVNSADHMTKTSESGENVQTNLTTAMTPVVYQAEEGYHFPTDYAVTTVNGIMVRRDSSTQITVYGTPSANAEINLKAPTSTTQEVKPNATFKATGADTGTLSELVDGGSYAVSGASSDNFTLSGTTSKNLNGISAGILSIVKKAMELRQWIL